MKVFDSNEWLKEFQRIPAEFAEYKKLRSSILGSFWLVRKKIHQYDSRKFKADIGGSKESLIFEYYDEFRQYLQIGKDYENGNLTAALNGMKGLLTRPKAFPKCEYSRDSGLLFRIRGAEKDKYQIYGRKDMFHMPFNLRNIVDNQRYNINGFPCLYLGASIYGCWEETRRPDLERMNVVAYRYKKAKPLRFICLDYPKTLQDVSDVKSVVLFLLCSHYVKKDDNKYKFQYVFPELLLLALINLRNEGKKTKEWQYDGIAYLSTRFFQPSCLYPYNHENMMNYVIPVYSDGIYRAANYSERLRKMFQLSEPMALFSQSVRGTRISALNPRPTGYVNSLFYQMEQELEKSKFREIDKK